MPRKWLKSTLLQMRSRQPDFEPIGHALPKPGERELADLFRELR
jgi:hypothetical protein